jgi:DHA1 family tetracycline resistance protein-like MFS transporter
MAGAPGGPGAMPTPTRAAFLFIFITVVLDMLALGLIVPVLPPLIVSFRGGDTASGATIYGLFGTAWALMQFVFSPVLGSLSDRFGRRRVILLSNFGLGLDYLLMALAPSLSWLFVGRVISGITSSSFSTAGAYIADVTPPEQRAARFGMLGAAFGVGFIIGPTVGGLLGSVHLRAPFWAAAVLSLANAAYGFFILPESLPPDRRAPFHWRRANPIGSLLMLRSHPRLPGLAFASFLSSLALSVMPAVFVLFANYRYQWNERTVGLVLGLVGVSTMIVQGGLIGRLVAALGERRALALGFLCGAAGMAIYGLVPTGALFFLGIPLTAVYGLTNPTLRSLMTRYVGPTEQGQLQGANASVIGFANLIAPILFTQVFAAAVGPFRALNLPGAPFLVASLSMIAALLVSERAARD